MASTEMTRIGISSFSGMKCFRDFILFMNREEFVNKYRAYELIIHITKTFCRFVSPSRETREVAPLKRLLLAVLLAH